MSREDLATLERGVEAFNARDLETFFACFHSDVVYRNRTDEPEVRLYEGFDAFKAYAETWLEAFDDLRIAVQEWVDLGHQVVEVAELRGRGTATGAPVQGTYVFLWLMRDGRVIEGREYVTKEEALEVARAREAETGT